MQLLCLLAVLCPPASPVSGYAIYVEFHIHLPSHHLSTSFNLLPLDRSKGNRAQHIRLEARQLLQLLGEVVHVEDIRKRLGQYLFARILHLCDRLAPAHYKVS